MNTRSRHHATATTAPLAPAQAAPDDALAIGERDRVELIDDIRALFDQLQAIPSGLHWIEQLRDGDMLTVSQAMAIADVDRATIHRWCGKAEQCKPPFLNLSIIRADRFVSKARLFDWIEKEKGLHARRQAETRAAKIDANAAGMIISEPE